MFATSTSKTLFIGVAMLLASPLCSHAQTWAPYFGNTHFGYGLGSRDDGGLPSAVKLADLDGDGDLDAVVARNGASSSFSAVGGFTVLLNSFAGFYGAQQHYASRDSSHDACRDVVVADFTADGLPDIAVANTGQYDRDSTVTLFRGIGGGAFSEDSTYRVGLGPTGLVAADLNGDGLPDLAVSNYGGGLGSTVSILYNNGAGHFGFIETLTTGIGPRNLAVGRLNGDTLPDFVVALEGQSAQVFLHAAGSGFQADSSYAQLDAVFTTNGGAAVALADVEGDGDLDVFYASRSNVTNGLGAVTLRRNTGIGRFGVLESLAFENFSTGSMRLAVADLNGDTLPDLVTSLGSGRTGDGYRVQLNQGNGQFGPAIVRPGGQWTGDVAIGDVTQDGRPDIVALDEYSKEMTVHANQGSGQFAAPNVFTDGVAWLSGTIEASDVDGDGYLDVIASSDVRSLISVPVTVFLNNRHGSFLPGSQVALAGVQAKARDLNGDGKKDLLYTAGNGGNGYRFVTALNTDSGRFAAPVTWNVGVCAPEDLDAADMDNDGDLDVVAVSGCGNGIQISRNDGSGTFAIAADYPVGSATGDPLALGDFNGDGRIDVAVGTASGIAVLLADTAGGLRPDTEFAMDDHPFDILAADLNDDGDLDLASCNYGANPGDYSMAVRLGDGAGSFGPVQLLPAAYSPDLANVSGIACGDIDNDNDLDLMVTNNATNDMSIYLNANNTGVFTPALRAGLYYGARSPWFGDFNNDGHSEVAALVDLPPNGFTSGLVVLQGTNSGLRTAGAGTVTATVPWLGANALKLKAAPNPYRQSTTLTFSLPKAATVMLTVYNGLGQAVASPVNGPLPAGRQSVVLGGKLPAGAYCARLSSGGSSQSLTLVVE